MNIEHWPFSNVLIEMNFVEWDFFTLVLSSNISIVYQFFFFSSFSRTLSLSLSFFFLLFCSRCHFILFSTWALRLMFGVHLFKQNEMLFNENKVIKWNVWLFLSILCLQLSTIRPNVNRHGQCIDNQQYACVGYVLMLKCRTIIT